MVSPTYRKELSVTTVPPPLPETPPTRTQKCLNGLSWAAGIIAGRTVVPHVFSNNLAEYRAQLNTKINKDEIRDAIFNLAESLVPKIKAKISSNFLKGAISGIEGDLIEIAIAHALVNLKGAKENPDVIQGALETIIESINAFGQTAHPLLKASALAYKNNEDPQTKKAALEVLTKEFAPLVDELIQKAGLDQKGLSKIISFKSADLENLIKSGLTEQCIEWYLEFSKSENLSESEQKQIRDMGGADSLKIVSQTIVEKGATALQAACAKSSDKLAAKLSEMALSNLSLDDQKTLAKSLMGAFSEGSPVTKTLTNAVNGPINSLLLNGLCRLAIKSPATSGTVIERVEGYVKGLLKELKLDQELVKKIKEYRGQIRDQELATQKLSDLKLKALHNELTDALKKEIVEQEKIVEQLKAANDTQERKRLLQAFKPLVKKVLADMGYELATDLPLPKALQQTTFLHLTNEALPELLLDYYGKVLDAIDCLTENTKERSTHTANLRKRFGNDDLANSIRPYAQVLIKSIMSTLSVQSDELAAKGVQKAKETVASKQQARSLLSKNQDLLVKWAAVNGVQGMQLVEDKYGQAIEDETEAFLIRMLDNFTANIEKIEEDDPKRTFVLVHDLISCLTQHLRIINRVTREQKKSHMYEVNPLVFVKEFEKQKVLDPAMPGYELSLNIKNLELKIDALVNQINKRQGDLNSAKLQLEEAKLSLTRLQEEAACGTFNNFHKGFLHYFLALCSINDPSDLPGPKELQNHIWEMLHSDEGAAMVSEIFLKAFEPEKLDKYLRIALENVNESLQAPDSSDSVKECTEEDNLMADAAISFLREVRRALPGTIFGKLHRIDEVQKLPANIVAKGMRKGFKNYNLNQLIEYSVIKGSKAAEELLDEGFPKTAEEVKAQRAKKAELNQRDIKEYHKQAGATVYNGAEAVKQAVIGKWAAFQTSLNTGIEQYFGRVGIITKRFFDPIFRVAFIECMVKPAFSVFNLCMRVFYYFYAKQVVYHAEHFRRCVSQTPIHANFGLAALRLFRLNFASAL